MDEQKIKKTFSRIELDMAEREIADFRSEDDWLEHRGAIRRAKNGAKYVIVYKNGEIPINELKTLYNAVERRRMAIKKAEDEAVYHATGEYPINEAFEKFKLQIREVLNKYEKTNIQKRRN